MSKNQTVKTEQQSPGAYDVKIHAVHLDGPVIADASATYNGCFAIRGLKLVKGDDGPYVSMPGYQTARGFVEVCTPNTPDVYEQLKAAVMDAYRQKLTQMRDQSMNPTQEPRQEAPVREQIPTSVAAKINTLRDGPTLADVSVDIGGAFTVSGVRIVNSESNKFSPTVIVASITSRQTKAHLPTHVNVGKVPGMNSRSIILLEQVRTIDKSRLLEYVGYLRPNAMRRVNRAIEVSMGCDDPRNHK